MNHDVKKSRRKIHLQLAQYNCSLVFQVIKLDKIKDFATYDIEEKAQVSYG